MSTATLSIKPPLGFLPIIVPALSSVSIFPLRYPTSILRRTTPRNSPHSLQVHAIHLPPPRFLFLLPIPRPPHRPQGMHVLLFAGLELREIFVPVIGRHGCQRGLPPLEGAVALATDGAGGVPERIFFV